MRKLLLSFLLILAIIITCFPAFAAQKDQEITVTEKMENAVFLVSWVNEAKADVSLVKPNGDVLTKNELKDQYVQKTNSIAIFVNNPELGNWKLRINGEGLGKVSISLNEISDLIEVTEFSSEPGTQNLYTFSWNTANFDGDISVSLYADDDNTGYNGTEITTFIDRPTGNKAVTLDNISSGDYYFYIKVKDINGVDDYMYTQGTYTVVNPNAPADLLNVKATAFNDSVKLKWDKVDGINQYKIMLFSKGSSNPFYTEYTEDAEFISPPVEESSFDAAVAAVSGNNLSGAYKKYQVDLEKVRKMNVEVKFPEKDTINTKRMALPLTLGSGLKAYLYVNNKILKENITTSSLLTIDLIDGPAAVGILVEDNEGNVKNLERNYYIDTYPPQLTFSKDYSSVITSEGSIVVSGEVEPDAKLFFNNKAVETRDNGVFIFPASLHIGKNTILIKAVDEAGNATQYTSIVNRFIGTDLIYTIISLIAGIAVLVFMVILFIIKRKKNKPEAGDSIEKS